jgi:hypothetical protein
MSSKLKKSPFDPIVGKSSVSPALAIYSVNDDFNSLSFAFPPGVAKKVLIWANRAYHLNTTFLNT